MPCDPFRQNHKRIAADALLDIYGDTDQNNLFLSIGKILPWDNEDFPPQSIDSVREDTNFWRSVFAHKRIDREDVAIVVRRYDWKPGGIYTPYRDSVDLFDDLTPSPFYVLVDEERVYKCIDNNNVYWFRSDIRIILERKPRSVSSVYGCFDRISSFTKL